MIKKSIKARAQPDSPKARVGVSRWTHGHTEDTKQAQDAATI